MGNSRCYECGTFNPMLVAAVALRHVKAKNIKILDPSAGWGDRMIGALALGCSQYVGFDPNTDLGPAYAKIIKAHDSAGVAAVIPEKYSNAHLPKDAPAGSFHLVITSPPFYDQEIYTHTEKDVQVSYAQWLKDMYEPYLRNMMDAVCDGGIIAVSIDNVPRIAPMGDDTNRIFRSEKKMMFVEQMYFVNNTTKINGLVHGGYPRSLWIYRKCATPSMLCIRPKCEYKTTANDEFARIRVAHAMVTKTTKFITDAIHSQNWDGIKYEVKNVIERLLLMLANRAAINCGRDPVLAWPADLGGFKADLAYKFPRVDRRAIDGHAAEIDTIIRKFYSNCRPSFSSSNCKIETSGAVSKVTCGSYSRDVPAARLKLLTDMAGQDAVLKMMLRYMSIISSSQHWAAPIEYFRTLYSMGVRFESFASPLNSVFIRPEFKETHICTLFPDTDAPFGSIGGFFQTDFLSYWKPNEPPIVVVGPPYTDELILNIARRMIDHCERAAAENKAIRFILTHSNSWDYSEGFKLIAGSKWLEFDHMFKKGHHYYVDERDKPVTAQFDTRLFVMQSGMAPLTQHEKEALRSLFPVVATASEPAGHSPKA